MEGGDSSRKREQVENPQVVYSIADEEAVARKTHPPRVGYAVTYTFWCKAI